MNYVVVDVEADSSSPATGSMVCFGAVLVADISKTFYGTTRPITELYNPKALSISGFSRSEHEKFGDPKQIMLQFNLWLKEVVDKHPIFISDNPAFDWQWINYYFDKYIGENPFGFSARRIGDLYCGMKMNMHKNREWKKKFRKTKHDHNPVNDALGNAQALLDMFNLGLES